MAILVSVAPVNAIDFVCNTCSSAVFSVVYEIVYSVESKMRTIHRISWRYARILSAENSSALWTHGKQLLHFSSSGVFHAVSSLPMRSSSLKTLKFSEIFNTKISVGAAFKMSYLA
ncbi:hypothetical protein Y032_0144g2456 [Ancylostoma ceylanicum]|uniref:Uncharacterized protein n=1 Tax=Ancylostoma ceylanicum TaxID=53326 RepID=A0A016T2Z8_9BILA|nr:hypothetical protein Y032_0144g2456 [Ancylostoma ceylanicum]